MTAPPPNDQNGHADNIGDEVFAFGNTALRIPTTNEITQGRRSAGFDPEPFCAAPIPNQKRRLLMASGAIIVGAWWQS
jgi:hypothetical protein